jgi:hypothetical protein
VVVVVVGGGGLRCSVGAEIPPPKKDALSTNLFVTTSYMTLVSRSQIQTAVRCSLALQEVLQHNTQVSSGLIQPHSRCIESGNGVR